MRQHIFHLIFLSFLLPSPSIAIADSKAVHVVKAKFFIVKQGNIVFTHTVPYTIGQEYGWLILTRSDDPYIAYEETLTLEQGTTFWSVIQEDGKSYTVSKDHRVFNIKGKLKNFNGMIYHTWMITEGDKLGSCSLAVQVDNTKEIFNFVVK